MHKLSLMLHIDDKIVIIESNQIENQDR
jgi:hypothetical protein